MHHSDLDAFYAHRERHRDLLADGERLRSAGRAKARSKPSRLALWIGTHLIVWGRRMTGGSDWDV